jgi:hypothetical protein
LTSWRGVVTATRQRRHRELQLARHFGRLWVARALRPGVAADTFARDTRVAATWRAWRKSWVRAKTVAAFEKMEQRNAVAKVRKGRNVVAVIISKGSLRRLLNLFFLKIF